MPWSAALGAPGWLLGPLRSERHRSHYRSSAGLLWLACLCTGVWGVLPRCSPGLWDFWGFSALKQLLVVYYLVSSFWIGRSVFPYLIESLGAGAPQILTKTPGYESWYTSHRHYVDISQHFFFSHWVACYCGSAGTDTSSLQSSSQSVINDGCRKSIPILSSCQGERNTLQKLLFHVIYSSNLFMSLPY